MKLNLNSHDPIVTIEFILVGLATISFVGGVFVYVVFKDIVAWNWIAFTFFILVKNWLEFFESYQDRRRHSLPDDERLPFMMRRLAD